jgi:cytochrome c oxidase subunit 2
MRLPSLPSNLVRWSRTAFAVGCLALLSGCDLNFWRMDGHQTTMVTAGPVAKSQLEVFYVTCWVTLVIFVLVGAVLAYATFKFKAKSEADEHAEPPPQGHGNPLIELSLIGASIFALVIIAVPTLKAIWFTYEPPAEQKENIYEVTATGYQWWFKFEYPMRADRRRPARSSRVTSSSFPPAVPSSGQAPHDGCDPLLLGTRNSPARWT